MLWRADKRDDLDSIVSEVVASGGSGGKFRTDGSDVLAAANRADDLGGSYDPTVDDISSCRLEVRLSGSALALLLGTLEGARLEPFEAVLDFCCKESPVMTFTGVKLRLESRCLS